MNSQVAGTYVGSLPNSGLSITTGVYFCPEQSSLLFQLEVDREDGTCGHWSFESKQSSALQVEEVQIWTLGVQSVESVQFWTFEVQQVQFSKLVEVAISLQVEVELFSESDAWGSGIDVESFLSAPQI